MLIADINTAGASATVINGNVGQFQIAITGTWNAAIVELQKYVPDNDSWQVWKSITEDCVLTVDHIGGARFRTNTTITGSAPVLVCEVLGVGAV